MSFILLVQKNEHNAPYLFVLIRILYFNILLEIHFLQLNCHQLLVLILCNSSSKIQVLKLASYSFKMCVCEHMHDSIYMEIIVQLMGVSSSLCLNFPFILIVCVCACTLWSGYGGWNRALDLVNLELQLQMVVRHSKWVLGTELGSSVLLPTELSLQTPVLSFCHVSPSN